MAKPLRTENPAPPSMQFAHFGVLNDGSQSKASLFTSISLNILIAIVVCILGAAAKKAVEHQRLTQLVEPIPIKKVEPEPIKPKIKPLPTPPVVKVEPPKIKLPDVKLPDIPKPPEIKMTQPVPVVMPAPPKLVQPPPAPRVVNLAQAQPATVMNNSHIRLPCRSVSRTIPSHLPAGRRPAPSIWATGAWLECPHRIMAWERMLSVLVPVPPAART